eukprot:596527-Amphidinium_carterae.1
MLTKQRTAAVSTRQALGPACVCVCVYVCVRVSLHNQQTSTARTCHRNFICEQAVLQVHMP